MQSIKKIDLLVCYNQYESKHHFTKQLSQAFSGLGIETQIFEWKNGPVPQEILELIKQSRPDLTCSFNQPAPDDNGKYFWDHLEIPHWTYLVDPLVYEMDLLRSPYTLLSCVDRNECRFAHSLNFSKVFFCPHATESHAAQEAEKVFDVVFLGSCYDPEGLQAFFKQALPKKWRNIIEDAAEVTLKKASTTFVQALLQTLASYGLSPGEVNFSTMSYLVDVYARGLERLALIRSIKDATVHVFGGKAWIPGITVSDWPYYLSKQKNVRVYPAVNYAETRQILARSKICLNSMPFFKDGTHERVLDGIAWGAFPLSSRSSFLEEQFKEGKEIAFYTYKALDQMNDLVNEWIHKDSERERGVAKAQETVRKHHSWKSRAQLALQAIEKFLGNPT